MSLAALFSELQGREGNAHDKVTLLITGAIESGINRGRDIVAEIAKLGFHPRFVGIQLKMNCGPNPARHRWRKGEDGSYHLH